MKNSDISTKIIILTDFKVSNLNFSETSESYSFLTRRHCNDINKHFKVYSIEQCNYGNGFPPHGHIFGDMAISGTGGSEHISFLSGVRIIRSDRQAYKYSGYQVMRLATELVPAVSAIITPRLFSPFWVVIFYFTMIVFGLAQQMALFHTVSSGLIAIKSDYFLQFESSLIFISCLLGLIFCFPLATEVNTKL